MKNLSIQKIISKPAMKRLNIAVLPRAARLNVQHAHVVISELVLHERLTGLDFEELEGIGLLIRQKCAIRSIAKLGPTISC